MGAGMEVRHNTALLEKAVELVVLRAGIPAQQAEAEALHKRSVAIAQRRLATGVAIGVAALGIGLGLYFGLWGNSGVPTAPLTPTVTAEPRIPAPALTPVETSASRVDPVPRPQNPPEPGKVTVDFSKFANVTVPLLGKQWTLSAGHKFKSDRDPTWESAWCYTVRNADGASIKVDLAERLSAGSRPIAPQATTETLSKVGLDDESALALATKCPWLDNKRYRLNEFTITPGRKSTATEANNSYEMRGRTLNFKGTIDANFLASLSQREFDKLSISSRGGLIMQAIKAGDWLRGQGKSVEASDECLSACVFVLAGGAIRQATPATKVGVHRFYTTSEQASIKDMEIGQQVASDVLRYLDRMGIDQAMFHAMAAVPSEDMAYIDHPTLQKWRLLGSSVSASAPPLPPPIEILPTRSMFNPTAAFSVQDSYDALGADAPNMPVRDIDQPGCERLCREKEQCAGYSFNKKFNACFLKNSIKIVFRDATAVTGYRPERSSPRLSQLKAHLRREISGEVYRKYDAIEFDDCAVRCDSDNVCRALNYDILGKKCVLIRSISVETDNVAMWSAIKIN